jgi:xylulose-5-phosphate/fructose-6-phosphate phosphoketolase
VHLGQVRKFSLRHQASKCELGCIASSNAARSRISSADHSSFILRQIPSSINYLCIGQIYSFDNPLLRLPLTAEQIKPRFLGHWGTSPGQNFIYIHLNRLIKEHDADIIYISGSGLQSGRREVPA